MIKILFSKINELPDAATLQQKINELPLPLKQKILTFSDPHKQVLSLAGKLLLKKIIDFFSLPIDLKQLQYINGKPLFKSSLQFNLSYSQHLVVCAGTLQGKLGIDVEKLHSPDLSLYQSYFTPQEWESIKNHKDPYQKFFEYWTRKEAVLKATGSGIIQDMQAVDVIEDVTVYEDTKYYLQKVDLAQSYFCHLAYNNKQEIEVNELDSCGL